MATHQKCAHGKPLDEPCLVCEKVFSMDDRIRLARKDLLATLEEIAHRTADFKHGDDNLELFVRGLGSLAQSAIDKTLPQPNHRR